MIVVFVLLLIVIVAGVLGNVLNILVFSKVSMRKMSTFRFLLFLSIADMLVLIVCALNTLTNYEFHLDIGEYSSITCRLHKFFSNFFRHLSSIILMVISIDRALVISNKSIVNFFHKLYKRNSRRETVDLREELSSIEPSAWLTVNSYYNRIKCKLHRVDIVMIIIGLILAILNSHFLMFFDLSKLADGDNLLRNDLKMSLNDYNFLEELYTYSNKSANNDTNILTETSNNFNMEDSSDNSNDIYMCFPVNEDYLHFLKNIWDWTDFCIYTLIPFLVMSVCSLIIFIQIRRTSSKYFSILRMSGKEINKKNMLRRFNRNRQILYMLLITNIYFFFSLLPFFIFVLVFSRKILVSSNALFSVRMCSFTNNAINVVFYGFSSQKYRDELFSLFISKKSQIIVVIRELQRYNLVI